MRSRRVVIKKGKGGEADTDGKRRKGDKIRKRRK